MQPGEVTQETEGSQKETSSPCQGAAGSPSQIQARENYRGKQGFQELTTIATRHERPLERWLREGPGLEPFPVHPTRQAASAPREYVPTNRALSLLQKKNSKLHTLLSEEEGLEYEQTEKHLKQDSSKTKQIRQK